MPSEIIQEIIDSALIGNRGELLRVSRRIGEHVKLHPYETTLSALGALLGEWSNLKSQPGVEQQPKELAILWHTFFRHQLSGRLYHEAYHSCYRTRQLFDGSAEPGGMDMPLASIQSYYQYLKKHKAEPMFQPGAWRLVNPNQLPSKALVNQVPLLALTDALPSGHHVLGSLRALLDPQLIQTVRRGWDPSELEHMRELLKLDPQTEWSESKLIRIFSDSIDSTTALVMARLATTDRLDCLEEFMTGLWTWLEQDPLTRSNASHIYRPFNCLAIILAALARNISTLGRLTDRFTGPYSDSQYAELLAGQRTMVKVM
ncbi:hypothetical protein H4R33_002177 [Dimargaris cristalligena]|nr:hypothetical protein H4R33_002177 [Dimargaris cristalligena]